MQDIKGGMTYSRQTVVLQGAADSDSDKIFNTSNVNILLLVPKYNFSKEIYHHYTFPIGLGYVNAILKNAGYQVDCINLNQGCGTVKDLVAEALDKKDYDYVCTGGNDLIFYTVRTIIETVHEHKSKPKIILAGHILTHEPELMIDALKPDFGVISEGEITILELLECLEKNQDLKQVAGIIYSDKDGKITRTTKRAPIKDIDSIPFPDYEDLGLSIHIDNTYCNDNYCNNTLDFPRTYPFLGSRGCAYNCTFCWHPENYRWRSIENIMEELRHAVRKYKINNLNIVDDCFSIKQDRVYEFCKRIKELSKEVGWDIKWTCQLLVHTVDRKLLHTMKDAGCESISYGFESFSPIVLRSMMKPITPEMIDRAFHATLDAKIAVQAHFIFGDTAETKETTEETINYWIKNGKGQIGLGFIQPYPGSVMYQRCIERGILKDRLDYIKNGMDPNNCFNMTDSMSDEELKNFRKKMLKAYRAHIRFVRPISIKDTGNERYRFEVKCPFCKEIVIYNNCYIKNKYTYGFNIICKNCCMRFFIVSIAQKIAYKHYEQVRSVWTFFRKLLKFNKMEHSY